ncbi:SdiA-regulated domain-containing protein [Reichenbachiella agarivorans]|uniref:SdiA-regulated domain-containing protein n=1 Tax=Reichenbachiella agarivorans TaxID=2979464 RepID=A0ABY6CS80_9BACT|nr:SdiA-regulated domain-containing protein [Reichenbachiella agarivorans]UXP32714.1 SdiA-regulated domain-containing protein [Reichenbachiella agarivorans]
MRKCLFILSLVLLTNWANAQSSYQALQLVGMSQLQHSDSAPFDLSGIVRVGDHTYVVADKEWNTFLYEISMDSATFGFKAIQPLVIEDKPDIEAIAYCQGNFYLANERNGGLYRFNIRDKVSSVAPEPLVCEQIPVDFYAVGLKPDTWGNAGWEGLAIDCEHQILYLIKERQPRFITTVDMNTWHILDQFTIPETESNDFADAKFNNGYLYLIERNGNYITKVDPRTKTVVDKRHYRHVASHPDGKLFGPEKFGMAEALLMLEDEIWIGLDNNGHEVTEHAKKVYGLSGNKPVIIRFERPIGF